MDHYRSCTYEASGECAWKCLRVPCSCPSRTHRVAYPLSFCSKQKEIFTMGINFSYDLRRSRSTYLARPNNVQPLITFFATTSAPSKSVQEGSTSMCSGLISLAKFRVVNRHWLLGSNTAGRMLLLRFCEQTHHRQVRTRQSDSPAGSGAPLSYTCSHSSTTRRVDKQRL